MKLGRWPVMSNIRHNVILSNHGNCVGGLKKVVQKLVEVLCHIGLSMHTDEFTETFCV